MVAPHPSYFSGKKGHSRPTTGRLSVGVWHDQWQRHMGIPEAEAKEKHGPARWQKVDSSTVGRFVNGLKTLLERDENDLDD